MEEKKPIMLKIGKINEVINLTEIYEIIEPMDNNSASCKTYEEILSSKRVLKLVKKNSLRWAEALINRMNSVHTSHDNFDLHNK